MTQSHRPRPSDAAVQRRRQEVLAHVIDAGEARIDELTERFGVSLMTMHRDIDDLAARRLLRKLRGRAMAYPALTMETAMRFRETLHVPHKEALARRAAAEVGAGATVYVDDSTTMIPLTGLLARLEELVVITNSPRVARSFAESDGIEVVLAGGRYRKEFDSCVGPEVIGALGRVRADIGFCSATAVAGGRLYHPVQDYAELKRAALGTSARNVLLVDHSKLGKTATHGHGDVGGYDLVLTDGRAPAEEVEAMRELGARVETVTVDSEGDDRCEQC